MSVPSVLLIFSVIGVLYARQPDIDINRLKLLPYQDSRSFNSISSSQNRRSIDSYQIRNNDYDDHSSRLSESRPPIFTVHNTEASDTKAPFKVHKPREDPKLYYQSDAYLKEVDREKINDELTAIYPGREVVRADEDPTYRSLRIRTKTFGNYIKNDFELCVRCPHDLTLVAKPVFDHVILQSPRLLTCSGRLAPKSVRFVHMHGPRFGSLLGGGSHMIVGRIMHNNSRLQYCKMHVHVFLQKCPVPKYLVSHCEKRNEPCSFSCRNKRLELYGNATLTCGDDITWQGDLPICKVRTWCQPPPPPDHGHMTCKGTTAGDGPGLAEGSRCHVRCARGYRWNRAATICRRGAWTHNTTCIPKKIK